MAAISSPQYVWTLLTKPLAAKLGVGLPELQVTFSLLIILQTFFSPFQGRLVEKFGPRRLIAIGTVMAGMSWVLSAQVNGLATLWLVYGCMGGLGTGIVYIGVVGLMVKWFPQHRGFAAAAVACALAQTIDQLIVMRFFHGLAAAAASVVINALMRDIYRKEEFSRMMSVVMLVAPIAPLMAPIVGGWVLVWLSWHYIFWILAVAAILASAMIFFLIKETLPPERRQPFHIRTTIGNFAALFR
ncbi:hypothetical protein DMP70_09625, partial [Klebsiella pneumoniae]